MTAAAWIDLETTSSDETRGSILEIGVVITNDRLEVLDQEQILVFPDPDHMDEMPPVVRDMHRVNGLLDDIEAGISARDAGEPTDVVDLATADRRLKTLMARHARNGRVILAGSGVGHFDARWIRRHLPSAHSLLTFWAHDVGVVRRFLGEAERTLVRPIPGGVKSHRGLDDALDHLHEWRHYLALITDLLADRKRASELETVIARAADLLDEGADAANVAEYLRSQCRAAEGGQ